MNVCRFGKEGLLTAIRASPFLLSVVGICNLRPPAPVITFWLVASLAWLLRCRII
ncbi:TPA: hypothetical protein QHR93_004196 [Citrobacter freundii]|nr:hypothetical protein [Citrobacter freundii]